MRLNEVLGWNIKTDGIYGDQTRSAVRGYQTYVGLEPDGIVGPKTWDALIVRRIDRAPRSTRYADLVEEELFDMQIAKPVAPTFRGVQQYVSAIGPQPMPPQVNVVSLPGVTVNADRQYPAVQQYGSPIGPMHMIASTPWYLWAVLAIGGLWMISGESKKKKQPRRHR